MLAGYGAAGGIASEVLGAMRTVGTRVVLFNASLASPDGGASLAIIDSIAYPLADGEVENVKLVQLDDGTMTVAVTLQGDGAPSDGLDPGQ